MHPYTRIEFIERDLKVSRLTATKYLDALAVAEFLHKVKVGRSNYYINVALNAILTAAGGTGYPSQPASRNAAAAALS